MLYPRSVWHGNQLTFVVNNPKPSSVVFQISGVYMLECGSELYSPKKTMENIKNTSDMSCRKRAERWLEALFSVCFSLSFQDQIRTAFPSIMKCSDNTQKLTPKIANQWHRWCSVLKSLTKKKLWTNRKRIMRPYLFCVIEFCASCSCWVEKRRTGRGLGSTSPTVTAYRAHLPGYFSITNQAFVLFLPPRSLLKPPYHK